jgi:hypothetical protein
MKLPLAFGAILAAARPCPELNTLMPSLWPVDDESTHPFLLGRVRRVGRLAMM